MGGCGRATKRLFETWLEFENVNSSARDPQRQIGVLASLSECRIVGALYVDGPTHSAERLTPGNVERADGKNSTPPNEIQDRGIVGTQEAELDPPAEMKSTVKMGA